MSQDNPVQENAQTEINPMYQEGQEPSTAEKALNPETAQTDPSVDLKQADQEFAKKFAALSRREKELREMEARFSEREEQIKKMEEQFKVESKLKDQLKYNPLKAMEEHGGYKFEDLTKFAMNGGDLTPEMKMELMRRELEEKYDSKIESLKSEYEKTEAEKAEKQREAAISQFQDEIKTFVDAEKDEDGTFKFEYIRANEATDLIYDVIEQHHNETGKILDIGEAAAQVESYLEEEAKKLLELSKVQRLLNSKKESQEAQAPGQSPKTLSNVHASQTPKTPGKLSKEQSIAEAAKLLRWND